MNDKATQKLLDFGQRWGQQFLTNEDYFKNFLDAKDSAAEYVLKHGSTPVTFLVYGRHRGKADEGLEKFVAIAHEWDAKNTEEKQEAMGDLAARFRKEMPEYMPIQLVQYSEGWMSHDPSIAPSKDPKREETLLVFSTTLDMRNSHNIRKMVRDTAGKLTHLEDYHEQLYQPGDDPQKSVSYLALYFYLAYHKGRSDKES